MERVTDAHIQRLAAMPPAERREQLKSVSVKTVLDKCRESDTEEVANLYADAVWIDMEERFGSNFIITK